MFHVSKTRGRRLAFVLGTSLVSVISSSSGSSAECVPKEVNIADFVVNGEPDLDAYLAALAAAEAACGGKVPSTGSDVADLLPYGLVMVGAGGVLLGLRRRLTLR